MIRNASTVDMVRLIEMGRTFHAATDSNDLPEFDVDSFVQTASWMIASPIAALLVLDDGRVRGMAGGMVYPAWFNLSALMAQEIFWWVDVEGRGSQAVELRRNFETRMKELGAGNLAMLSLAGMRDETMERFYRREGYRPMENLFIKRL